MLYFEYGYVGVHLNIMRLLTSLSYTRKNIIYQVGDIYPTRKLTFVKEKCI